MATIIDGKKVSKAIKDEVREEVLALKEEGAEKEWQELFDTFNDMNLTGKCFAIYVPSDSHSTNKINHLKYILYQRNARHIINQPVYLSHYSIEDWISAISPNL